MNNINRFIGSSVVINSKTWGQLYIESASFTPAIDGDLIVHIGKPFASNNPLVRIHSECIFSEIFDSDFCDCADQFNLAMNRLKEEGEGILFYLRFDGRGAGLAAKVKATSLEIDGMDTYDSRIAIGVPPEGRNFESIGWYLMSRGITHIRLLTNNPNKGMDLEKAGINIIYEPLLAKELNANMRKLYHAKATRFNHNIPPSLYA
jgi:GTP cyclohydrolase II